MGNQLVGIAPSQIYAVEHYFSTFSNDITFDSKMGSTRFFKVAKVKCNDGFMVAKVFVKHDPTLPLEEHKKRVYEVKSKLANAFNCLSFQRVELTDKAAYLMRDYVKHSLYDRVSTRPFLTILEKKWITFQVLCALNQCHRHRICHGDIKLENILITSWNWVLLTDFATYKPTYLPEDNPADYTYFFDTSRRRICYIAPERFVKSISSDDSDGQPSALPTDSLIRLSTYDPKRTLLPSMDIFSTGCSLIELWTEGSAPFELSQLLAYRRGEREHVEKHLASIENENVRNLLASMISLDSIYRKTAEVYLDEERGRLFPIQFYDFLQPYLHMLFQSIYKTPDEKIVRLHRDMNQCILELAGISVSDDDEDNYDGQNEACARIAPDHDGLILIITVVTSFIRALKHSKTKLFALEILQKVSKYTTSETILDRILPYILHLAQTSQSKVQVQAIETLTYCLSLVKDIPRSDANVFPEYILPAIVPLSTEQSAVIVRAAFARNITKLAKIAIYFLEETQRNAPNDMPMRRYEAEINALHEIVQQIVVSLLTDSKSIVKQTLMESGICDLCAFFGKEKANDVILSHVMTFLNDEDKNLRGSFYDNIAGVAGYVGWQASDILVPLLQQGFTDREEYVIGKAIRAITILVELGHIKKPTVTDILKEVACFLCHPNIWVRYEICELISTAARTLSAIDIQCKIMPSIRDYLSTSLIQVEKSELLLDCIKDPIPRQIYDSVLRYQDIHKFMNALEERAKIRENTRSIAQPQYEDMGQNLPNLFRRLDSEGLNETVEMQLIAMKSFLFKLKYKTLQELDDPPLSLSGNGRIIIKSRRISCHELSMNDKSSHSLVDRRKALNRKLQEKFVNRRNLIGGSDVITNKISTSSNVSVSPLDVMASTPSVGLRHMIEQQVVPKVYDLEKIKREDDIAKCKKDLENLCQKVQKRYSILAYKQHISNEMYICPYPSGWRMKGNMVAHLHEHSESVGKLTSLKPFGAVFASASFDGTVRLWDCNKLNGNQGINKSLQAYPVDCPIYCMASCENGQCLCVGGRDGNLLLLRVDRNSSKMALQEAMNMDKKNEDVGSIVDVQSYDHHMIIYATVYGKIFARDLRSADDVWHLRNELRHGLITTICVDPTGSWLATGTSGGKHVCWDLRFRLPIAEIRHPADAWIRKVCCHPTEASCLISASQSNNEVSVWNMETGHRQTVLWASPAPVLSNTTLNEPYNTCGILSGTVDNSPFIITGSSDQRIRYWNINSPKNSALVVPSSKDNLSDVTFQYDARLIDGSHVIKEEVITLIAPETRHDEIEEDPRSGPDLPSVSHHDAITDLIMCKSEKGQNYVISSSRDGIVKIWK